MHTYFYAQKCNIDSRWRLKQANIHAPAQTYSYTKYVQCVLFCGKNNIYLPTSTRIIIRRYYWWWLFSNTFTHKYSNSTCTNAPNHILKIKIEIQLIFFFFLFFFFFLSCRMLYKICQSICLSDRKLWKIFICKILPTGGVSMEFRTGISTCYDISWIRNRIQHNIF